MHAMQKGCDPVTFYARSTWGRRMALSTDSCEIDTQLSSRGVRDVSALFLLSCLSSYPAGSQCVIDPKCLWRGGDSCPSKILPSLAISPLLNCLCMQNPAIQYHLASRPLLNSKCAHARIVLRKCIPCLVPDSLLAKLAMNLVRLVSQ